MLRIAKKIAGLREVDVFVEVCGSVTQKIVFLSLKKQITDQI